MIRFYRLWMKICVVLILSAYFLSGSAFGREPIQRHISDIEPLLKKIETEQSPRARWDLADELAMTLWTAPDLDRISDDLINRIILLLRDNDEAVQFSVAKGLGRLGPRAMAAVPELERIMREADASEKLNIIGLGVSTADTMREALTRITGREYETRLDYWRKHGSLPRR